MKNRKPIHDNWETPKELYNELNKEFNFDCDPCPLNAKFDGLKNTEIWGSSNFINPPYSRKLKELFIIKAYNESLKGNLCVLLLPVSTSTKIFHEYIYNKAEIRFIKGRIKFVGSIKNQSAAPFPSMIVIFKNKNE